MSDQIKDVDGAGKTIANKLSHRIDDQLGEFRTVIQVDPTKTTMLRTRGGSPEMTVVKEVGGGGACEIFPLEERAISDTSTPSQLDRIYYYAHNLDPTKPERRKFSSDGIFSLLIRPLMRIRFKSKVTNKYVTVWLNDHSKKDADLSRVSASDSPLFTQGAPGGKLVEVLMGGKDGDIKQRKYHDPVFIPQRLDVTQTPGMDLHGFGFIIKRIKELVFSVAGIVGGPAIFRAVLGDFDLATSADTTSEKTTTSKAVEKNLASRAYFSGDGHKAEKIFFGTNPNHYISIAAPGGILEPLATPYCDQYDFQQHTNSLEINRPLTNFSEIEAWGQPWHGYYEIVAGGSSRILWDSPDKNYPLLTHNTDPLLGPVHDLKLIDGTSCVRYYKFSDIDTVAMPANPLRMKLTADAALCGDLWGPEATSRIVQQNDSYSATVLYKDPAGTTWVMVILLVPSIAYGATLNTLKINIAGRLDNFEKTYVPYDVPLVSEPWLVTTSASVELRVKNSPDGTSAAVMLIDYGTYYTPAAGGVMKHRIVDFAGTGSVATATIGQGITCALGANDPFGPINTVTTIWDGYSIDGVDIPGMVATDVEALGSVASMTTGTAGHAANWYIETRTDLAVLTYSRVEWYRERTELTLIDIFFNPAEGLFEGVTFHSKMRAFTSGNPGTPVAGELSYEYFQASGSRSNETLITKTNPVLMYTIEDGWESEQYIQNGSLPVDPAAILKTPAITSLVTFDWVDRYPGFSGLFGYTGYNFGEYFVAFTLSGPPNTGRLEFRKVSSGANQSGLGHCPAYYAIGPSSSGYGRMSIDGVYASFNGPPASASPGDWDLVYFAYDPRNRSVHQLPTDVSAAFI